MKNILKSLIALTLVAGFSSCEDEQDLRFLSPDAEFRILSPISGEGVVLMPETPTNPALVMTWEEMDYGTPTEVTYSIEVDANGNEFASPIVVATTTSNFISINSETLNGAAISAGLVPFSEGGLDVRVKSSVGTGGAEVAYSDVITYLVTPYTTEAPKLYVVGNFQGASGYGNDWTPSDAVPIAASGFGETDFEGYVYMNVPSIEYKILPTNESFDGDYGDDGTFGGVLIQEGEQNIQMAGPGYFRIKANTETLTYSAQPTSWGLLGSATAAVTGADGWTNDANMTYDPATKKWTITIDLTAQEVKFRANDDWGLNYGDTGADGSLNEGGDNIAVPAAGNYTVTLDLSNPREYTYELHLN